MIRTITTFLRWLLCLLSAQSSSLKKLESVNGFPQRNSAEALSKEPGSEALKGSLMSVDRTALVYMACTIYGEARGEPIEGKEAVGWVIFNRAQKGGWYGNTIKSVVLKPWQFSCWNVDDPNYAIVKAIKDGLLSGNRKLEETKAMDDCMSVSYAILSGETEDNTEGSYHYHSKAIIPIWAAGKAPVAEIGDHLFYNDID